MGSFVRCSALILALAALGCKSDGSSERAKPTGTPTDPVAVCERAADVCRLDDARLGVCVKPPPGAAPAACEGRDPCFLCMSQH